jgi:UDP-N-acetylmuramate dehydrogenase
MSLRLLPGPQNQDPRINLAWSRLDDSLRVWDKATIDCQAISVGRIRMVNYKSGLLIREHVPLAPFTSLQIGGPARYLAEVALEDHLLEALELARRQSWPLFVLGGGSNVLVSDSGFPGLVIRVVLQGIRPLQLEGESVIHVAAGENWDDFVKWCVERDLAGIECLSGIPGTVGGTPIQNVGAYGAQISDTARAVRVMDRATISVCELRSADCGFAYRESIFNTSHRDQYIVLGVTFGLRPAGEIVIDSPDLKRYLAARGKPPSLAEVRELVLRIRAGKGMILAAGDPDSMSAGSFFRNPIVSLDTAHTVEESARKRGLLPPNSGMARFEVEGGKVKLPAAWLIEGAGFHRGYARGSVGLSSKHALAIINRGGARASEVLDLMREIQAAVQRVFGVDLQAEPSFVGFANSAPNHPI